MPTAEDIEKLRAMLGPGVQPGVQTDQFGNALTDSNGYMLDGATPTAGMNLMNGLLQSNPQFQAQQQEVARRTNEGTQGLSPEQYAQYQQTQGTNARFGNDLSWLDPSMQYSPTTIGASAGAQAYADPNAIAAQNSAMQQAQQFANSNLQFQSPAQQQALMQQWAGIQSGQGAPTFMGNGQQQALMQGLLGVAAPKFAGDADQRNVLNQALGMASNTGPGSLKFDDGSRQSAQYGNLQDIIKGGGATAIEMADRQRARADSESWLRGQREADMADYAERGLTGSGMELLNLSSDRQAAAGRNSQADLDMAKALEERRLGAINSAAGLATNMRGQTVDEQGLLNNRATSGLSAASGLVNNMRSSDIQEQMGLNSALQSQFTNAAGIAGTMRGQDTAEKSYLDQRGINALTQQTDLSNTMRNQTASEQVANRSAQLSALGTLANTSNAARGQSAQEAQFRGSAEDDRLQLNQAAINNAASANTNYLQNAQQNMMNNRQQWEQLMAQLGISTANNLMGFDQSENVTASNQATNVGSQVAGQFNNAQANFNGTLTGTGQNANANTANAQQQYNALYPQMGSVMGKGAETLINMGTGGAGGGAAGVAAGAGATGAAPVSGAPLSTQGTTWAQQGSFLPQGYKLEDLNK